MPKYAITPVPAPRMTQRDRWAKRPCYTRYMAFKDEVRLRRVSVENGDWITFYIPMPKSWPKKRKEAQRGQPHQSTPDADNLLKALLDAVFSKRSATEENDDSHIYDVRVTKIWDDSGAIEIKKIQ